MKELQSSSFSPSSQGGCQHHPDDINLEHLKQETQLILGSLTDIIRGSMLLHTRSSGNIRRNIGSIRRITIIVILILLISMLNLEFLSFYLYKKG